MDQAGDGEFYLDSPRCLGSENNLLECVREAEVGDTRCTHSQAAGVRCQGK